MKSENCQRYLEDPEAHAAHLAECAECRTLFGELNDVVANRGVKLEVLPLAPWEEASHRPWPLILGIALGIVAIAAALFAMAGQSPLGGFINVIRNNVPSADLMASILRLAGGAVQNAPGPWQIAVGVAFVIVNAVLFLLLRRSPKGIDV
ncbi:MAG: hypothetical protein JJE51_06755 [Thermoanaerobaculia bacterium]|nr:hypothetical protein [Thermoanaerobaculia bacterium]